MQQSVNVMSCMIRMTRMRDTAAGEHPTRDDLSGEGEEKHDGTSDNRRQPVEVEEGTTILQAAKKACIHIPTLCYHEDLSIKAVCRICVVEVEGRKNSPPPARRCARKAWWSARIPRAW